MPIITQALWDQLKDRDNVSTPLLPIICSESEQLIIHYTLIEASILHSDTVGYIINGPESFSLLNRSGSLPHTCLKACASGQRLSLLKETSRADGLSRGLYQCTWLFTLWEETWGTSFQDDPSPWPDTVQGQSRNQVFSPEADNFAERTNFPKTGEQELWPRTAWKWFNCG